MKRKTNILINLLVLSFLLISCASDQVIVGKVRPPIKRSYVRLYTTPPKQYEEIAYLSASSKGSYSISAGAKTSAVIESLRAKAAKLGANGLLLKDVAVQFAAIDRSEPIDLKNASGQHKSGDGIAIYVIEE